MNPKYGFVADRANHRCEYCAAPERVFNFPFEVEHIIPLSLQGSNDYHNLALACRSCNLLKGNRIGRSLDPLDRAIRYFHPRQDSWAEHFRIDPEQGTIVGLTEIGQVTIEGLVMNSPEQSAARRLWIQWNLFP